MYDKLNKMLTKEVEAQLTSKDNKKSDKYVDKLNNILEFKQQAQNKIRDSKKKVVELNERMEQLNNDFIMETDSIKLEEITKERNNLIVAIKSHEGIIDTKFMPMVNAKLEELEAYHTDSYIEYQTYLQQLTSKREEFVKLRELIDQKLIDLHQLRDKHSFREAERIKERIKTKPKVTSENKELNLYENIYM